MVAFDLEWAAVLEPVENQVQSFTHCSVSVMTRDLFVLIQRDALDRVHVRYLLWREFDYDSVAMPDRIAKHS